jgi:hypothetical protein
MFKQSYTEKTARSTKNGVGMKISFWDVMTGILMFAGFGVVLVFANIFIDPNTILNPFPPPTLQPTLAVPTMTPTLRSLPDIWTVTPTGNAQTVTLMPSLTPVATKTGFILPTVTASNTASPIPSLTPIGTNTPTRTNTPPGGKTFTPTPSRTPTGGSFTITGVDSISASPSSWTGVCPKNFSMSANIRYTGDGTLTYYWVRSSDNAHLSAGSMDTDGTSPDTLSTTLTIGTTGFVNTSTYYLYVDNPNHQQFTGVSIPVVCSGLTITSNGGGATAAISVAENTTAITTVTTNMGGTTYSITGGADSTLFSINAATGVLVFTAPRDFEAPIDAGANNTYEAIIHAVNGSFSADQTITVTVTNANDNAPVITSNGGGSTAAISVAENVAAVTTVTATDADAGSSLTYSISGGTDAGDFTINASTGALTFNPAPNFESPADSDLNNIYEVIVQVSDGTNTDTQTITVTVTNVNEAPTITSNGGLATAAINVAENTTAVTTVTATDPDAGATLAYSISGGADAARFNINSSTGALTFASAPDFEVPADTGGNNVYDVTVQVSDGALTDAQDLAVTVTDQNDNSPVIAGGAIASYLVPENSTSVTTVNATDADAGTVITYTLVGGADMALFTINSSSGALSFLAAPDFETPLDAGTNNVYDVIVRASDGTNTADQTIDVTVTNVADPT